MEDADKEILGQMDINSKNTCFITLKDYKENFLNNPTVRLINPGKNELGRISKAIFDNIIKRLCTSLNINQWKNTASLIEWFKRIEQIYFYKLIMFNIKRFLSIDTRRITKQRIKICPRVHRYHQYRYGNYLPCP